MSKSLVKSRIWIAFFAACAILVQAMIAVPAAASMAASPTLDAFGNALCLPSGAMETGKPSGDHKTLPDCCTFGCMAAAPVAAPPADGGAWLQRPLARVEAPVAISTAPLVSASEYDPGRPRAPPAMG
ncbi:hypothetical protein QBK99_07765 [Corticibacterium sp. UT-5YL-CI-8]|nr:hypothetical protein [Tianweitania sp. UT-5YL-CI-8]